MKLRDQRTGRYIRTTPDYKQLHADQVKKTQDAETRWIAAELQVEWLYRHAPFWLKLWFNHIFN